MGKKAVALFGPTASGKTGIAIELARKFNGEIINMDSVQIYRKMDIGSAKPDLYEQSMAKHHLIDIAGPDVPLNSFEIYEKALEKGEEIASRGKLPIFAGGTGLYFKAIFFGLFRGPGRNPDFRSQLRKERATKGVPALYDKLKKLDPETAARISENDYVRIERALEVYHETGKTIGELHSAQKYTPPFDYLKIALSYPREELYERINSRVEQMIQSGLVEEVQALVRDFPRAEILHSAIGYKEVVDYLENTLSYEEMIENLKRNSRRFAKRQITLFNKISGVFWFTPPNPEKIGNLVEDFLNGGQK